MAGRQRVMPERTKGDTAHTIKTLVRLFRYIGKSYRLHLTGVLVLIVVSVLANVQGTMFIRSLIDDYVTPMLAKGGSPDYRGMNAAIGRVALFYALGVAAAYLYNRMMIYVTQGSLRNLRGDLFSHMETLPLSYFDSHERGDIMSVYTNDIDTLRQMISQSVPQLVNSAFSIVSVLVSMLILDLPLTLLTLAIVALMLFAVQRLGRLSGRFFGKQQRDLGAVNGYIEEMMAGEKVVKVFNHEEAVKKEFDEKNEALYRSGFLANAYAGILMPINAQLGNISYVACAMAGGLLTIYGVSGLTIGKLASFLAFNKSFHMPISQVSMQFNAIIMASAGANRIFALMDEVSETDDGYVSLVRCREEGEGLIEAKERTGHWAWRHIHQETGKEELIPMRGDIVMEGVDFSYVPGKLVLHDVTLYARPGQKIAFVGSTGAGKTTITNLINRFYDIADGKIRYDGININKIRKADLRRSLGMVLQETNLFSGTVADNIRFGRLDASEEEVVAAARLANADGFIRRLPKGYDTVLTSNGANLSQGQRQLLAIARAAIADPPALILDEATSSIDTRTEKIVSDGMDRLMEGRTSFVIAHRLSTVRNADCIMVLEQGRIIERGSHDQLMEARGRYFELYTGNALAE